MNKPRYYVFCDMPDGTETEHVFTDQAAALSYFESIRNAVYASLHRDDGTREDLLMTRIIREV